MTYAAFLALDSPTGYAQTLFKNIMENGRSVCECQQDKVIEYSQIHHFLGRYAIQRYCFITCTVSTIFRKEWACCPYNSGWWKEEISAQFWAVDFLHIYDFEAFKFKKFQLYPPFKNVLLTDVNDILSLLGVLTPGNPLIVPSHCAAQGIWVLDSDWEF